MLPGGIILLNRRLVEETEQPEVAAGYVLLEQLRAKKQDPLDRLLREAGGIAAFRLLTTGRLSPDDTKGFARKVLTDEAPRPDYPTLLGAFAKAGFSSAPLAYEIDMTGETTLPLIEADPLRNRAYKPLMSDANWIALQAICGS